MNSSNRSTVLDIQDLSVAYHQGGEWLEAVHQVSLQIKNGETYGLAGESGSGKTTLVLAVLRYLGSKGSIIQGQVHLGSVDMRSLGDHELRQVWGKEVALVPQNPQSSLNPSIRVGEQIAEGLQHQGKHSREEVQQRTLEWLHKVRIPDPKRVYNSYPHQISGGMQQRVLIAMALSTSPQLLILDEPTSNLDVTTQAAILDLIDQLLQDREMGVLYVTHNLGVIAQYCNRVGVMYAGELIEEAASEDLFSSPLHPYTQGLLDSIPQLGETKDSLRLQPIPGHIPAIGQAPSGCVFRTRCPIAIEICTERPALYPAGSSRLSRCHRWEEIARAELDIHPGARPEKPDEIHFSAGEPPVLELEKVSVSFPINRSIGELLRGKPGTAVQAVNNLSLAIPAGETLGLVGESGSGKTTIARSIMGLQATSSGAILLHQEQLPERLSKRKNETLRRLQIVLQNPHEALNPYISIGETLQRPFARLLNFSKQEAEARVAPLLEAVHLPVSYARRLPGQLSGGEIQRVALARAIACDPDLLILDEPISSLDVSVQAAILNLVNELQGSFSSSQLFISHNLAVVGYLADKTAVIYAGCLMEICEQGDLFTPPHHPYTEALLSAIPRVFPGRRPEPVPLEGEIPDPANLPGGCPFHTRCHRYIGEICATKSPPWQLAEDTDKKIFCHIPLGELSDSQVQDVTQEDNR